MLSIKDRLLEVMTKYEIDAVDISLASIENKNMGGYINAYKSGLDKQLIDKITNEVDSIVNSCNTEAGDDNFTGFAIWDFKPSEKCRVLRRGVDY